ncbi:MAG: ATP-binding cassette domain-containing protein [Planctomycetes bacterium]|nr:ATP-binding cassette domain-containing protein [Planctomycetota bacterium]
MVNAQIENVESPRKAADTGPRLDVDALTIKLGGNVLRLAAPINLKAGRLYLLWGPSGSGKSSFARALLGLGELSVPRAACEANAALHDALGVEHTLWQGESYNPAARRQVAFMPQADRLGFIDGLSTAENLRLFSRLSAGDAKVRAENLAARFHLMHLPAHPTSASGGERMRLSAVRALLPRAANEPPPALVIADEPTAGLDALAARALAREIIDLARRGESVVVVITHDPSAFTGEIPGSEHATRAVRVLECELGGDAPPREVGRLQLEPGRPENPIARTVKARGGELLNLLGGAALSPLAFLFGLARIRRPGFLLKRVVGDCLNAGTHMFAWLGALLIAGTVAYFIFEQLPRPELVEPLLLTEILEVTGHTLVRVVLPLGTCALVTGKLGAAQAARTSAAVRSGLLETLALGRWAPESFALAPAVIAQVLAMALSTALALVGGVVLAALIYTAGHEGASLGLALDLMLGGLDKAAGWREFLVAKVLLSGFAGGVLAALFGLAPAMCENDVAKSVHRTLLWGVLAVLAVQCALIIWEFSR